MAVTPLVFITFLALGGLAIDRQPPTVQFKKCKEGQEFDKCAKITFHDNGVDKEDWIGLTYRNGEENNMNGTRLSEPGKRVSVTIDKGVAFMMVSAKDFLYNFEFNMETGVSEFENFGRDGNVTFRSLSVAPRDSFSASKRSIDMTETRALPAQGFLLNILVFYDNAFASRFRSRVSTTIEKVFNHVETFFSHSSLGTSITPNILGIKSVDQTLPATRKNLGAFSDYIGDLDPPYADAYALLSFEQVTFGSDIAGVANRGVVCEKRKKRRTSISEHKGNDIMAAELVVHELGHNLGMRDDLKIYDEVKGSRLRFSKYARDNSQCIGIGSYMSYEPHRRTWSRCSVEDFTAYYQQNQPFCLKLNTGTTTAPTPENPQLPCRDKWSFGCNLQNCWRNDVKENCKLTCKECGDENPQLPCCDKWSFGCNLQNCWRNDVKENCKLTCGECGDGNWLPKH